MKKSILALVFCGGAFLLPLVPNLPALSECYLRDANGRRVDLSRLCGVGNTSNEPNLNSPARIFKLPIERRVKGIPTVMVTIDGRHRYEMLFDTGASGIALTDEMAAAVGARKEREIRASTAGGVVTAHLGRVKSIRAGNLTLSDPVVLISSHMEGMGLLGQSFFGEYDVTIKKDVIELRPR